MGMYGDAPTESISDSDAEAHATFFRNDEATPSVPVDDDAHVNFYQETAPAKPVEIPDSSHTTFYPEHDYVPPADEPPVANAGGPYSGTAGVEVQFNGLGSSDPDNAIATYAWTFGDNGTGTGATPQHTYNTDGTYDVSLTVTDEGGLQDTDTTTATIAAAPVNQPPVANVGGPYNGTEGLVVQFDGSGSTDPENDIVGYNWTFGDGNTGTGVAPQHAYSADGTFNVSLTVTDGGGLQDADTTTATIVVAPVELNQWVTETNDAWLTETDDFWLLED